MTAIPFWVLRRRVDLTVSHSSLIAVKQRVQSGAVIHHKHASSRSFDGDAALLLHVQRHLHRKPSVANCLDSA